MLIIYKFKLLLKCKLINVNKYALIKWGFLIIASKSMCSVLLSKETFESSEAT